MINIERKLDEIRQKPEHIRIRYVWGAVGVSMILVVGIWFFSIKEAFKSTQTEGDSGSFTELKNQFNAQDGSMPSFDDLMSQPSEELSPESIEEMGTEELPIKEQLPEEDATDQPDAARSAEPALEENKQQ